MQMRDQFVNETIEEAKRLARAGARGAALDEFGKACHTLMDASSPEHTNDGIPKPWNPLWPFGHSPTNWLGQETSSDISPATLESQKVILKQAYKKVFGGL